MLVTTAISYHSESSKFALPRNFYQKNILKKKEKKRNLENHVLSLWKSFSKFVCLRGGTWDSINSLDFESSLFYSCHAGNNDGRNLSPFRFELVCKLHPKHLWAFMAEARDWAPRAHKLRPQAAVRGNGGQTPWMAEILALCALVRFTAKSLEGRAAKWALWGCWPSICYFRDCVRRNRRIKMLKAHSVGAWRSAHWSDVGSHACSRLHANPCASDQLAQRSLCHPAWRT